MFAMTVKSKKYLCPKRNHYIKTMKKNKNGFTPALRRVHGFTFIEMLIVLTIIGLLVSIGVTQFVKVQRKGRDSQRMADLRQVQAALEMYRSEQGAYPDIDLESGDSISVGTIEYMSSIPADPKPDYKYFYQRDAGSNYKYTVCAYLEDPASSPADCTSLVCGGGGENCNYGFKQP